MHVERLAFAWMDDSTTETIRESFEKKVCSFVDGDLDHAVEMLSALWDIATNDEDVTAPESGALSTVSSFQLFFLSGLILKCSLRTADRS